MIDTSDVPLLHPSLQKRAAAHRRLLRLTGLLIFLIMAGALVFLMATAFSNRDLGSLLLLALMGLIILPMITLLGGLLWYLDHWHERQIYQAHCLLRENQPLTARLIPIHSAGRRILFALHHPLAGGPLTTELLHVFINPFLHWNCSPRSEITVQLYCQQLAPDHDLVALQADGDALIGKVIALEAYCRQRRRRRMMTVAIALLALAAILVALAKN